MEPLTTAVRIHQFGGPEVLVVEQIPVPEPSAEQLLVRIHAAGVGPWDAWIRSGQSVLPQPLPLTLGSDVAGIVVAAGSPHSSFEAGAAVYGVTNARFTDGYAEYALVTRSMVARKPAQLTFVEAASVPVIA